MMKCDTSVNRALNRLEAECARLRDENERLRKDVEALRWLTDNLPEVVRLTEENERLLKQANDVADMLGEAQRENESLRGDK